MPVDKSDLTRWQSLDAAVVLIALADYAKEDVSYVPRLNTPSLPSRQYRQRPHPAPVGRASSTTPPPSLILRGLPTWTAALRVARMVLSARMSVAAMTG